MTNVCFICFIPSLPTRTTQLHCTWRVRMVTHDVVQTLLGAGADVNIATSVVSGGTCNIMSHVAIH